MKKIKLLDNNTINKIAAGEVVERPSSVVKELVENSIDANSTSITVEIKDGGTTLIRITDNGDGIPKDQVKTAFIRHATSKIVNIEDLENVISLGFRGEALASIASVSQVEMQTKTHNEMTGTFIEINGEELINISDCGCSEGTSIVVRNLFYNVPARRKFLKKPATESGYISDMINKIALAHPEISFKFINNESVMLHTSGNNDLKSAIFYVYGKEIAGKMLELDYNNKSFSVTGMIGKPELSRANRNYENLFINGRYIKSDVISQAIEDAYKTRLMTGKFPVFALNFSIPPSMVDVNVHPTKLEVRFHNDDEIYDFFYNAVTSAFKDKMLIPEKDWDSKPSQAVKEFIKTLPEEKHIQQKLEVQNDYSIKPMIKENQNENSFRKEASSFMDSFPIGNDELNPIKKSELLYKNNVKSVVKEPSVSVIEKKKNISSEEKLLEDLTDKKEIQKTDIIEKKHEFVPFFKDYKIIGQMFSTYWAVEQNGSIFIIDQHAAHERILFEDILNKFKSNNVVSQMLIQPVAISLTSSEKQILNENKDLIEKFGFEVEEFGGNAFAIRAVPYIFKQPSGVNFFIDIIDMLGNANITSVYDTKLISVATIACKAAVKANDKLSYQEAVSLIEKLLKLENPFSCPHGRPTIIEMTKYELEKKFNRIV